MTAEPNRYTTGHADMNALSHSQSWVFSVNCNIIRLMLNAVSMADATRKVLSICNFFLWIGMFILQQCVHHSYTSNSSGMGRDSYLTHENLDITLKVYMGSEVH